MCYLIVINLIFIIIVWYLILGNIYTIHNNPHFYKYLHEEQIDKIDVKYYTDLKPYNYTGNSTIITIRT